VNIRKLKLFDGGLALPKVIFIIEDDENIRELVSVALSAYSYSVLAFPNAEDALTKLNDIIPDLCIFDIMLPGMDGLQALKYIRNNPNTMNIPVLMLTAKSAEVDKVIGLESGADDYLAKPFGIMELTARVKALLRRAGSHELSDCISIGDITIDMESREVRKSGKLIELTLKEFELLKMLMKNNNKAVSREDILNEIWGYDFVGETRTLDMHIRTLRQKLGDDAEHPIYIKTVRGFGYKFSVH
jgi:two-component system alkaline phosphatase synthesis response regulator PhoP